MKENFAIKILFHVQFIVAGIVLHKRDINGRSSRIGSPCNDSSPPRHPLSISFFPGLSYASLVKVASYLSLPRFILDFRPGHTRGRKPLIYALSPDRSIRVRPKFRACSPNLRSIYFTRRNFEKHAWIIFVSKLEIIFRKYFFPKNRVKFEYTETLPTPQFSLYGSFSMLDKQINQNRNYIKV